MKLKISKETAVKLYPEAPEWFQEVLVENFGVEVFAPKKHTDIKTFSDACRATGVQEKEFYDAFNSLSRDTLAYEKLKVIVAAINQGWVPDWTNSSQYKYYPCFNLSSGSGFVGHACDYYFSLSSVGSRLCFESSEKCLYAVVQFQSIYEDFFIIK